MTIGRIPKPENDKKEAIITVPEKLLFVPAPQCAAFFGLRSSK